MRSRRFVVAVAVVLVAALVIPLLITVAIVAAQPTEPGDTGTADTGTDATTEPADDPAGAPAEPVGPDAPVGVDGTPPASLVENGVRITRGIVTAQIDDTLLTVDVYQPEAPGGGRPAVVLIHGGAWFQGSPIDMDDQGRLLAEQGWVGVSISYRLASPGNPTWPVAFADVQRQIRWVGANAETLGVDPTKIALLGASAGGHLATLVASLGTTDFGALSGIPSNDTNPAVEVAAVVAWSPPLELASLAGQDGQPPTGCESNELCDTFWAVPFVETFLGCDPGACPETYAQASPPTWVKPETTPIWLANATKEIVPIGQLQGMAAQLSASGVDHSIEIVPGEEHANGYSDVVWNDMTPWLADRLGVPVPNPVVFPATGSVFSSELAMALVALVALCVVVFGSVSYVGRQARAGAAPTGGGATTTDGAADGPGGPSGPGAPGATEPATAGATGGP